VLYHRACKQDFLQDIIWMILISISPLISRETTVFVFESAELLFSIVL